MCTKIYRGSRRHCSRAFGVVLSWNAIHPGWLGEWLRIMATTGTNWIRWMWEVNKCVLWERIFRRWRLTEIIDREVGSVPGQWSTIWLAKVLRLERTLGTHLKMWVLLGLDILSDRIRSLCSPHRLALKPEWLQMRGASRIIGCRKPPLPGRGTF